MSYSTLNYLMQRQMSSAKANQGQLLRTQLDSMTSLSSVSLQGHYGCVNGLQFSPNGKWLASGSDDMRVILWRTRSLIGRQSCQSEVDIDYFETQNYDKSSCHDRIALKTRHNSNVFNLDFTSDSLQLISGGNDGMVLVHDITTAGNAAINCYNISNQAIADVATHPYNPNLFTCALSEGFVYLVDLRQDNSLKRTCLLPIRSAGLAFHSVHFNPMNPRFIVTTGEGTGACLYDLRNPNQILLHYASKLSTYVLLGEAMSARFNSLGSQVLVTRRRERLLLYDFHSSNSIAEFDHVGYYNSCTTKSSSFAGLNDEYVMAGSDNFRVHLWRIPTEERTKPSPKIVSSAHITLSGHHSIVNKVCYSKLNDGLIASSGIEKVIRLWSTLPINTENKYVSEDLPEHPRPGVQFDRSTSFYQFHFSAINSRANNCLPDIKTLEMFDVILMTDLKVESLESDNLSDQPPSWEQRCVFSGYDLMVKTFTLRRMQIENGRTRYYLLPKEIRSIPNLLTQDYDFDYDSTFSSSHMKYFQLEHDDSSSSNGSDSIASSDGESSSDSSVSSNEIEALNDEDTNDNILLAICPNNCSEPEIEESYYGSEPTSVSTSQSNDDIDRESLVVFKKSNGAAKRKYRRSTSE